MPRTINGLAVSEKVKFDDKARARFLRRYAETGLKKASAASAGVTLQTVRNAQKADALFASNVEEARQVFVEKLEEAAYKRAVRGISRPIVQQGRIVTRVKEYSDSLLSLLLKANSPNKYRDNIALDATIQGGVLVVPAELSIDEWSAKYGKEARKSSDNIADNAKDITPTDSASPTSDNADK